MLAKVAPAVIGSVVTALIFALFGYLQRAAITIPVPKNAIVAFIALKCPVGWDPYPLAEGRYVVGLVKNGALQSTVGKSLSDKEDRPSGNHNHAYENNSTGGSVGNSTGSGTYLRESIPSVTGSALDANKKAVPGGTNAPYVQLLYCVKN